jgi:hypothetical protein
MTRRRSQGRLVRRKRKKVGLMRTVDITKDEFDNFLYSAIAADSAKDENELEVAVRLMRKIKAVSVELDFTKAEKERIAEGERLRKSRGLVGAYACLELEEDEWKMVCDRLKNYTKFVSTAVADEYADLVQKIKTAETIRPTIVKEIEHG